jgi:hypothetical protein
MAKIDGAWEGRLIDAAGFEGSLTFQIKARRDKVTGTYSTSLVTQHGGPPRQGRLSGSIRNERVILALEPESDSEPKITFGGDLFPIGKGLAIKGMYDIEPRKYSPLVRGVVVMSTVDVRSGGEEVVNNPNPNDRRGSNGRKKRRKAR